MKIAKIDGKTLKGFVDWLKEQNCGCCHFKLCDTDEKEMNIVVGWHDYGDGEKENGQHNYKICWKIGMQSFNNGMQTDMDIDFDIPYNRETGEVYDTLEEVTNKTAKEFIALAEYINRIAKDVVKFQIDEEKRRWTPEVDW